MSLGGTGVFPGVRKRRVFWVGVTEGHQELARLANILKERLLLLHITKEKLAFKPHVTIGRFAKPPPGNDLNVYCAPDLLDAGRFSVDTVLFMKSVLKPSGAEYTVLAEHSLV